MPAVQAKRPSYRKQALGELVKQAHQEELSRALNVLAGYFDEWRSGKIDSIELIQIIHKFHQQTAHEIFVRYEMGDHRALVANAVATGMLERNQLPDELIRDMQRLIAYFEVAAAKERFIPSKRGIVGSEAW